MDVKKTILYLLFAFFAMMLWTTWQTEHHTTKVVSAVVTKAPTKNSTGVTTDSFVPKAFKVASTKAANGDLPVSTYQPTSVGQRLTVKTDVLDVAINLKDGAMVSAKLPAYPVSLKKKNTPMQLLSDKAETLSIASLGLTNSKGHVPVQYTSAQRQYQMAPGKNTLVVTLQGKTASGVRVIKTYTFKRGVYDIGVTYTIHNTSATDWAGSVYGQLVKRNNLLHHKSFFSARSYSGASISSPEKPFQELPFKWLDENMLSREIFGGWVAIQQKYFINAWVPNAKTVNHYYSHVNDNTYTVGFVSPQVSLKPGAEKTLATNRLYVGPEVASQLKKIAPGLDLTVDYGWLWILSKAIFWLMAKIHALIGNWGWAIVLTTIAIKLVFYKLSETSYRSMARMKDLTPRLTALKERCGDDKARLSKETMALYKKEKVSPLGGCLPMLIQIPFFIALYYVLAESVALRQAPFIFWIHDLAIKDPYYILPILVGISMLLQQKMSPPPPDPTQAKVMMLLPVFFTVMFLNFPAGLTLYWFVNNCLTVLQQWYVMKKVENEKPKHKQSNKKKS